MGALLLAAAIASGCGTNSGGTGTTQTGSAAVTPAAQTAPLPAPSGVKAEEQAAPYGPGTNLSQSVGTTIDGLQLKDIRWSDHGSFFRIVFDLATPDGQPLLQIPRAHAVVSPDGKQIQVFLDGIRSVGPDPKLAAGELQISDSVVASIGTLPPKDDQSRAYGVNLTRPANYALAGLGSPGRIVVDVIKSP